MESTQTSNIESEDEIFDRYSLRAESIYRREHRIDSQRKNLESIHPDYQIGAILNLTPRESIRRAVNVITTESVVLKETEPHFLEVDLLSRLHHPNLISVRSFWIGTASDFASQRDISLFLILEATPDDLLTAECPNLIYNLIHPILFLHRNGVVHGNINLEAFGVTSDQKVKLSRFSQSTYRNRDVIEPSNIGYLPPEILATSNFMISEDAPTVIGETSNGQAVDLWALGITIFAYLLGGKMPFGKFTPSSTKRRIQSISRDIRSLWRHPRGYLYLCQIPVKWHSALIWLLEPDPTQRVWNVNRLTSVYEWKSISPTTGNFAKIEKWNGAHSEATSFLDWLRFHWIDAEVVFVTMDLFYRTFGVYRRYFPWPGLRLAYILLGLQLGAPRKLDLEETMLNLDPNIHLESVVCIAGCIATYLNGYLYPNNLFTGVRDYNILKDHAEYLEDIEAYWIQKQLVSQDRNLRPLRIPMCLL